MLVSAGISNADAVEYGISIPQGAAIPADGQIYYDPEVLHATIGSTVTWENTDHEVHKVTSGKVPFPDGIFDSKMMTHGDVFAFTFEDAGEYPYFCMLHPWAEGLIIVEEIVDPNFADLLLTINNPTPEESDYFGNSVAVTSDGNIIVGAHKDNTIDKNVGSVYLFDGTDGSLLLTINSPTPQHDDFFGNSVAATSDGNIIVGAYHADTSKFRGGSAYLFNGTDGTLLLTIQNPTPESGDKFGGGDKFGWSVAATSDDNIIVGAWGDDTGATNAGSAYLFDGTLRGTTSTPLLTINNPIPAYNDYFGKFIAATSDGNILVGVPIAMSGGTRAGSVYLFDGTDGSLLLTINNPTPEGYVYFGNSVAATSDGNILVGKSGDNTGASDTGSAYLFNGTDGSLLLTINNPTPEDDDAFGNSVAATSDGNILVGAFYDNTRAKNAGSAYLFNGTDGTLLLTINNPTPEEYDYFGNSVAVTSDGNILVGAWGDNTGARSAGSVYLFAYVVFTDSDGDGIEDIIDSAPQDNTNNTFDDGTTNGVIITRGDQIIRITDEPFPLGVRIVTSGTGGITPAQINICNGSSQNFVSAGANIIITCGSTTWSVISGELDAVLTLSDNNTVKISLDADDEFFFDDINDIFTLDSIAGTAKITMAEKETISEITLTKGNSITIDPQTTIITADSDNPDVVIVLGIDDEPTVLSPGDSTVISQNQAIQNLIDTVISMNIHSGTQNSLIANLDSALDKLTDNNPNNDSAACGKLDSFENKVNAQEGKKLTLQQAETLRGLASDIKSVIPQCDYLLIPLH